MNTSWHSLLLSDSSLPVGGFAHSSGLESSHIQGQVCAESLPKFIRESLHSQFHVFIPFLKELFAILYSNLNSIDMLDHICGLDSKIETLIATSECQARASKTQ